VTFIGNTLEGSLLNTVNLPLGAKMSEIAEVERSRLRALVDGDIDLARTFHHPEFQLVTPRGVALSLDEYLAEIASGSIRYLR
jgi:hypothetical protein